MESAQYLETLMGEKESLDPAYHVNTIRLLNEGKRSI